MAHQYRLGQRAAGVTMSTVDSEFISLSSILVRTRDASGEPLA
jgi:hypothetical protein